MDIFVQQNGQQTGPFDEATVRARMDAGELTVDDLGWHDGLGEWKALSQVMASLAPLLDATSIHPTAYLVCVAGPDVGKRAKLSAGSTLTLGKALDCNVLTDDPDALDHHAFVSFEQRQVKFTAIDGSKVFIDGAPLSSGTITGHQQLRVGRSFWQVETVGDGFKKNASAVLGSVADRISSVAGLEKIEGLSGKEFFSTVLKKRGDDEVEALFITGTKETTPPLSAVDAHWPKPWLFFKMFVGSIVLFLGFAYGVYHFEDDNFYPGLIMIGAFAIPFSVLVFCIEMNVVRNVSFYQVLKLLFLGGIASLLLTLTLSSIFPVDSWFGFVGTGIVEEAGKVLAVAFLMGKKRYNWILNGLLFGAAVGAGFAAFESSGYILKAGLSSSSDADMIGTIITRALLAPGGHVVWCAIASAALWKVRGNKPFSIEMLKDSRFIRAFCFVATLHAIWDIDFIRVPFMGDWGILAKMLLLTIVAWAVALRYIQAGLKQVRQAQQMPSMVPEAPSASPEGSIPA